MKVNSFNLRVTSVKEVNVEHKVFNIVTNNSGKNFISIAFLFILNVAFKGS